MHFHEGRIICEPARRHALAYTPDALVLLEPDQNEIFGFAPSKSGRPHHRDWHGATFRPQKYTQTAPVRANCFHNDVRLFP